ncbi:hypothetical protein VNO78_01722 [Psophocarpus tetragonolobus]|uniref:Non-haem dioxygenase N-terminal domain-containing protein n=1 Tax=Psophocarpus tetragonolobus TaxID=3891 RepID=A0AAN9T1V9_PSOTE
MASSATISSSEPEPPKVDASKISSVKVFEESNGPSLIPPTYHSIPELQDDVADELAASIPVIDLSLLTSHLPQIHANSGRPVQSGLTNHEIPEKLMEEVMNKSREFHDLPMDEKEKFGEAEKVQYWRDYLKVITFPEFKFPNNPPGYREVAYDYSQKIQRCGKEVARRNISELGADLAQGMLPHSDHCSHRMELEGFKLSTVVSNGRYESVLHRAMLNNRETRMSLVVANGPALDKEIRSAPELLEKEKPLFRRFKYEDYFKVQQRTRFADKSGLDEIRVSVQQ